MYVEDSSSAGEENISLSFSAFASLNLQTCPTFLLLHWTLVLVSRFGRVWDGGGGFIKYPYSVSLSAALLDII